MTDAGFSAMISASDLKGGSGSLPKYLQEYLNEFIFHSTGASIALQRSTQLFRCPTQVKTPTYIVRVQLIIDIKAC